MCFIQLGEDGISFKLTLQYKLEIIIKKQVILIISFKINTMLIISVLKYYICLFEKPKSSL